MTDDGCIRLSKASRQLGFGDSLRHSTVTAGWIPVEWPEP